MTFTSVAVSVRRQDHPNLPIRAGELVFTFDKYNVVTGVGEYKVFVVARSGQVFLDDNARATDTETETEAVQVT